MAKILFVIGIVGSLLTFLIIGGGVIVEKYYFNSGYEAFVNNDYEKSSRYFIKTYELFHANKSDFVYYSLVGMASIRKEQNKMEKYHNIINLIDKDFNQPNKDVVVSILNKKAPNVDLKVLDEYEKVLLSPILNK